MLPINFDDNKYWMCDRCGSYIRSDLKCTPHENLACVFLIWTILQMEIDCDFKTKKLSRDRQEGDFIPTPPMPLTPS